MQCVICNEEGHRARDCTAERPKPGGGRTCRNCGQEGHKASDCTEEPNLDLVECKNCSQSASRIHHHSYVLDNADINHSGPLQP